MLKRLNLSRNYKTKLQIIIAIFALLCVLIGYLCLRYYWQLQKTVKSESLGYMQEISRQMGTNINKNIEDKYAMLGTMAKVIKGSNITTYEHLPDMLNEHRKLWKFQSILLIDEDGVAYNELGTVVALSSDNYLQEVIVNRLPSLSSSQVINGNESIIFAIPIDDISINGTKMLALAASYDLKTFDQMIAMTAFEGNGYAHIIRSDGAAVIRSSSPATQEYGYNILNSLSTADFKDGKNIDTIKGEILSGKSGQIEFSINGNHEYMTFMPLGEQQWSLLTFVPVNVVNSKSNMLLKITLLLSGFITIFFAALLAALFITFYQNKKKLEQIAYVDAVTGGNTIERFYDLAEKLLSEKEASQYALVYTNIEKFKVMNEQFGRKACDDILCSIEKGINADLSSEECIGHWFADNFCILIKYQDEAVSTARFEKWNSNSLDYIKEKGNTRLPLIMEFGIYIIDDFSFPFPQMIDRAKLSLNESIGDHQGKFRYAIYNDSVRHKLFREKHLEDRMEAALASREFQVYLQPKYLVQSEQIGGAEALVRWISSDEGMIYPDEFIPLFEKNGFVIQLDFFVFEEVCKTINKWLKQERHVVKVSVNCSRSHLKNMDFLERYCAIADEYQVPHHLLEIELTENTVFKDVDTLSDIIRKIRSAGFGCSMDDFGSGYSSLNLIQDIPVDTLKLDKVFFHSTRDLGRTESVVSSIIAMSKSLSMETVAEGVEKKEQVDMLKKFKCDYIQGYYFAKPMPIEEFEQLAFESENPDA